MSLPRPAADRLDALVIEYRLSAPCRERLGVLLRALADDEHAPTPVRDPVQAVDVHVADALTGLDLAELRSATTIADLGAGAGVPGLVLAAALPRAHVVLVESVGRKAAFIDRMAAAMALDNVEVVSGRAETWAAGLELCDAVTARALAALPVLVEYAAPLLRVGGLLVAWKGTPSEREHADGDHAARLLGLGPGERRAVAPWPSAERHSLYCYRKLRSTPNGYPRRAGVARKRPLTA